MFGIALTMSLNPRFPYCVITTVRRIVAIVILLFLSHSFVNYVGSRKQKLGRKKPKPRNIGMKYKGCGKD